MRLSVLAFLIACVSVFAAPAKAGLLLEPYAGYELGTVSADVSNGGGTAKFTANGPHVGARLGYALPLLWFALDYDMGMLNGSVSQQPTSLTVDAAGVNRTSLFAEAGVKVPMLMAYVGYGFMNKYDFAATGSMTNDLIFNGTAIKAGVAYSGLPFISISLDYLLSTFNKYDSGSGSTDLGGSGAVWSAASASSVMLTINLPFGR